MMAKKKAGSSKMDAFEKSGKDVEPKGVKEGSKKEMMMDKMQMKKMAKGGSASARADGIAKKGKTVGKFLAKGGKVKG
jgi:hypothetical protein